jgi:hypothetical protein
MLTTAKRGVIAVAIGAAALFASGGAVQASAASTTGASFHMVAAPAIAAALPNTNVSGTPAKFSPTSNKVNPITFSGNCTTADEVFTISNLESKTVTFKASINGGTAQPFGSLKAHTKAGVCEQGPKGTYFTYSIKGSTSKFKSTLK